MKNRKSIYLDYNATTPCDPRVVEAMLPFFYERPGNAASKNHLFGQEAKDAVEFARQQIANLIEVETREIIFTSGATEGDNLALKGIFETYRQKGSHIITAQTEHKAVLDTCKRIEKMGGEITYLPVDKNGLIDLKTLEHAIKDTTILVAIMWANNETGVIQPIQEIGKICEAKGVSFFSDATQAVGKIPVKPKTIGLHLLAFTAHKMYGPKGIGALYVSRRRPRIKLSPQIDGGGHEEGMRSGTLNVPSIVGFGKAAALAQAEMTKEAQRLEKLRNKLEKTLINEVEECFVNGHPSQRMAHVSNLSFRHVESEGIIRTFNQQIAVSTGSACTSASLEPSHVLTAMGISQGMAKSSIRFSLGKYTTEKDIALVIQGVKSGVQTLRAANPVWELFKEGLI